mgnify:CR=1 FL=1
MPIQKKVLQGVLVLGWLVWSLPAIGAGEHSPHEVKQTELVLENMVGILGQQKKDMVENIVDMVMVGQRVHLPIFQLILRKEWIPMEQKLI